MSKYAHLKQDCDHEIVLLKNCDNTSIKGRNTRLLLLYSNTAVHIFKFPSTTETREGVQHDLIVMCTAVCAGVVVGFSYCQQYACMDRPHGHW